MAGAPKEHITPIANNKRALHEFELSDRYIAGMVLLGTEIKSIRNGKINMSDAYCQFKQNELWVKNLNIGEYELGTYHNHAPLRERKLLLNARELRKLHDKVKERGYSIVPVRIFLNEKQYAKIEIALARGKKLHDKRDSIKERDTKREIQREIKTR
jgi:SsrA-binding protein